ELDKDLSGNIDNSRESIINKSSKQTTHLLSDSRKTEMQIEKQTEDMREDTRERALIKQFVSDFLLSKGNFPIESAMLRAIPQDKNKKLRFPIDQREAQAMKQLVDACYILDDFATKIKDIESHLPDSQKNADNTDNMAVVPHSNERV